MFTTTRRRRFVPVLDGLDARVALSGTGAVITPMDPVLLGGDVFPKLEVVVTPMDPILLGWRSDPSFDAPAYSDSAAAMGDTLLWL